MKIGYTLPVFAIASAKAALLHLLGENHKEVSLNLLESGQGVIPIASLIPIDFNTCIAITISDPGDNLDLTMGMEVWAWVQMNKTDNQQPNLLLEGGEGIGKTIEGEPAIYQLPHRLAKVNLLPLVPDDRSVKVKFILPQGREIAKRTSNQAFGILEGLSLLGTTAIAQPLSVEEKLEEFRSDLQTKASSNAELIFYIGANSGQVAINLGYKETQLVQTANWIGAMLVEAALLGVKSIVLVGYHGKLIKLAGGIFNTSSHITDARIDILVRCAVRNKLPVDVIYQIEQQPTAEAVHNYLKLMGFDQIIFQDLTDRITQKAQAYIYKYTEKTVKINTILCDRLGNLVIQAWSQFILLERDQATQI